jgi:hypothetical protein
VVDNEVIKYHHLKLEKKEEEEEEEKNLHLCLDKAYNSEPEEQELIKRGYVLHIPPKRKRNETEGEEKIKATA